MQMLMLMLNVILKNIPTSIYTKDVLLNYLKKKTILQFKIQNAYE